MSFVFDKNTWDVCALCLMPTDGVEHGIYEFNALRERLGLWVL